MLVQLLPGNLENYKSTLFKTDLTPCFLFLWTFQTHLVAVCLSINCSQPWGWKFALILPSWHFLLILRQGGQRCQGFNFIGTAIMSITIFTSRSVSAFISKRFPSSSQNRSICAKDPKFPNLTLSQESFCDRIEWETVVLQSQYLQKLSLKSRGFSLFLDKKKKYFCHLYLQSRTFGKRIAKALQLEYENFTNVWSRANCSHRQTL